VLKLLSGQVVPSVAAVTEVRNSSRGDKRNGAEDAELPESSKSSRVEAKGRKKPMILHKPQTSTETICIDDSDGEDKSANVHELIGCVEVEAPQRKKTKREHIITKIHQPNTLVNTKYGVGIVIKTMNTKKVEKTFLNLIFASLIFLKANIL
jgi:hypothetical protein